MSHEGRGDAKKDEEEGWPRRRPEPPPGSCGHHGGVPDNQLRDGDPPETRETLERLLGLGIERAEARRLIACVIVAELFAMMKAGQVFDRVRFVARLKALPEMPWDQDEGETPMSRELVFDNEPQAANGIFWRQPEGRTMTSALRFRKTSSSSSGPRGRTSTARRASLPLRVVPPGEDFSSPAPVSLGPELLRGRAALQASGTGRTSPWRSSRRTRHPEEGPGPMIAVCDMGPLHYLVLIGATTSCPTSLTASSPPAWSSAGDATPRPPSRVRRLGRRSAPLARSPGSPPPGRRHPRHSGRRG